MSYPARLVLVFVLTVSFLGAGCGRSSNRSVQPAAGGQSVRLDSVVAAGFAPTSEDLLATGAVTLGGGAQWDTLTTAGWMRLAAQSMVERGAARRADSTGAYLGDSVRVARLQPGDEPGTARVETEFPLGTPFETEMLHRFIGSDENVEILVEGAPAGRGRQMPSNVLVSFSLHRSMLNNVVTVRLGSIGGMPSEVANEVLPPTFQPDRLAHRLGVRYEPGRVVALLNGEPVAQATARLGGGPMTITVTSNADDRARAYLLRWTLDAGS